MSNFCTLKVCAEPTAGTIRPAAKSTETTDTEPLIMVADSIGCEMSGRLQRLRHVPKFVHPMAARVVEKLPDGDDWTYEVKFDGYRALVLKDGERLQIRSRNDKDLTRTYPSIAAAGRRLQARQAIVDGEIVAVDADGRPSFQALQHPSAHPGHTVVFYAFDLLHLNGVDFVGAPLHERRASLPDVLSRSGILLSSELPGTADEVVEAVRHLGLEGVIAKRRNSRYTPGERTAAWV